MKEKSYNWYPLLWSTRKNSTVMIKLIIDFAVVHNIVLEITGENKYGRYQLLFLSIILKCLNY